jgi:hypothetical protein
MKQKLLLALFISFAFCLNAKANTTPGAGEENARKSDVLGGVFHSETKKPLSNVTVTAYSGNSKKEKTVYTDTYGNFSFDELKPGTYKFVFEKDGFRKVIREKTIAKINEGSLLNINMDEFESYDFMPGPSQFFDLD